MTRAVDVVLGYHLNPLTCGVAKFNQVLAERLGLRVLPILGTEAAGARCPLVSVKVSELRPADLAAFRRLLAQPAWTDGFVAFLHEWTDTASERDLVRRARVVYCPNAEVTAAVRGLRPDAIEAWCPSTMLEPVRFTPTALSVFSFGMAHKVRADQYRLLRTLLEATGRDYRLYLSTALHEDTTLDGSFTSAFEELRDIFGARIYFLGYLSDTAVYNSLLTSTFFAAFFERGVRANNTTVNAAMSCGAVVVTNLDAFSPPAFVHLDNVIDIGRCEALPTAPATLAAIGKRARLTATGVLGWDALVETLSGSVDAATARPR